MTQATIGEVIHGRRSGLIGCPPKSMDTLARNGQDAYWTDAETTMEDQPSEMEQSQNDPQVEEAMQAMALQVFLADAQRNLERSRSSQVRPWLDLNGAYDIQAYLNAETYEYLDEAGKGKGYQPSKMYINKGGLEGKKG